jgi:hypothetical protein
MSGRKQLVPALAGGTSLRMHTPHRLFHVLVVAGASLTGTTVACGGRTRDEATVPGDSTATAGGETGGGDASPSGAQVGSVVDASADALLGADAGMDAPYGNIAPAYDAPYGNIAPAYDAPYGNIMPVRLPTSEGGVADASAPDANSTDAGRSYGSILVR